MLFVMGADAGEQLAGCTLLPAGDVHDIFRINNNPVGNGIHTYGLTGLLNWIQASPSRITARHKRNFQNEA